MSAQYRPSPSSRGGQRSRYTSGYSGDTGSFPAQRGGREVYPPSGPQERRRPETSGGRPRTATSRGRALATTSHDRALATRPRNRALVPASQRQHSSGRASDYSSRSAQAVRDRKKKHGGRKYVVLGILTLVVALLAVASMAAFAYVKNIDNNLHAGVDTEGLKTVLVEPTSEGDPFYVLLMGTDGREGESTFRSDTIILARVDPTDRQVTLISIPRDTYVNLAGYGPNKINAARAYGGPELAVSTVADFAGVDISHYIEVSFDGFDSIVDSLGGVRVNVPQSFYDDYLDEGLEAGDQILNGDQALVFCRSRHPFANGDFARSEHQRMFITALAKQILASDAVTMANTLTTISKCVTTDMSLTEILSLANQLKGLNVDTSVYSAVVPSNTQTIDGASYVITETSEWQTMMERVNMGLSPTDTSASNQKDANASDEKTAVLT